MAFRQFAWVVIGCIGILAGLARAGEISVGSLLPEMIDLAGMAEFPAQPYTCKQFSSWDRGSKSPTQNWFANADCGHYLRVEDRDGRKEHVMMDAQGPGAIVRIWSANPAGTLRIYIDGAERPVIEGKMGDILCGKFPGMPKPLAHEVSKGWNLYLPIPYAKSCKVTSDAGKFYYHVNYRTWSADTKVVSFTLEQLSGLEKQIKDVADRLTAPRLTDEIKGGQAAAFDATVQPGQTVSLGKFTGPRAIARLTASLQLTGEERDSALRSMVLKMTFDGKQTVESPLGDFFGSAPGINAYESLPLGMSKDGEMWSQWVMPFAQSAEVSVQNLGKTAAAIKGQIVTAPYAWGERSMHFHAKWRTEFDVPTRPMVDWNYMTAKGKGVFAGVAFAIDNPVKAWWGEGDEKIYVDGETFPSHFGTGTEDYYGYAWCWPGLFVHAYHNQTRCDGPGNFGRTSVNRWHILDRIPFTADFKFDMELWHWKECKVNMAVTAYYYAMPGATDGFKAIAAGDVVLPPAPVMQVTKVAGAIEGEKMRVIEKRGNVEPQDWNDLSDEKQLWWRGGQKPGDTLVLGFAAPKAGKYKVLVRCLKAKDYGIVQLAINGQKAGEPIDFYNATVAPMKEIELGVFDLTEGENRLSATVVGANEKAIKAYMFGLDYVLLKAQ